VRQTKMSGTRRRRGEGAFNLIVGLGLLFVVIVAGFRIIPLHVRGAEILDAMNEAANFGGLKGPDRLRYEVFQKAQDNRAPLRMDDIKVERSGPYIIVSAKYDQTVDVFGLKYTYHFDKKVEKVVF
jgi:hypothetical protein